MSKKSIKKSLDAGAYLLEKQVNVFSDAALKDEYFSLLKNIFGVSSLAVKIYNYAQTATKLDDYVILKEAEIAAALNIKNTDKISKAIKELLSSELITPAPSKELYCLASDKPFNEEKHDEILLTISIKKVSAIQEDLEPEAIKAKSPSGKFEDLKEYLRLDFGYTDKDIKELEEVFTQEGLTKEKFFSKVEEWQRSMRADTTIAQKRNYISACLLNEEWK